MQDTEHDWAALLWAVNAGEGRAYVRFLRKVAPVLRGIVRARGQALPPHHHENIVQEVLLAVDAKRHTWDESRPVRPWLYSIARHKVADAFRARGAWVHLDIADLAEVLAAEAGADPDVARDADRLLARIEPRAAAIVRAVHLDKEAPAEVGRRLAMSEGAVRVALHRALKRLGALTQGTLR